MCRDSFANEPEQKQYRSSMPDEIIREIAADSLLHFFTAEMNTGRMEEEDRETLVSGAFNSVRAGMDVVTAWYQD